jgi:2',3'-cyclic-nucleotide 2'-phosphodiesterase / 3'-nucleotidase
MKTKLFVLIFTLMTVSLLNSCERFSKEVKIKIITTTDVHAVIFPYDFVNDRPMDGSLARVHSFVNSQKENKKQHVILLDNGDLLQGQPTGYYFNFQSSRSVNLFADVLNFMQFDASSVGNHDIEAGKEVYDRIKAEFNFPWLAANIIDTQTGEPYFPPFTVIERGGVKIAILGLVTSSVPDWLPRKLWEGLEFVSMHESALKWMAHIQENEAPDAVIGLFHSGAGDINNPMDAMGENAAFFIGKNVPGFDVILTGHDHRVRNMVFENVDGNEVIMIAGQSFARSVAEVEMVFDKKKGGGFELILKKGEVIEMDAYEPDPVFMEKFASEFNQVKGFVSEPVGNLKVDLHSRDAYKGNAAFVDFIHDIQLQLTDAEISFAAPLSFDAVLNAGQLSMRDMFRLYPFENYLYVMELTGEEIHNTLEYSYGLWFDTMADTEDNVLLLRRDSSGQVELDRNNRARFVNPSYNFDSAAGIEYTVDVSKPAGQRITIQRMTSGTPFQKNKTYRVAVNSYRGSGGGGHLTTGAGIGHQDLENRIAWVSENDLRSHMADYFRQIETLHAVAGSNWRVVPVQWVAKAMERDFGLLFPENN